MEIVFEGKYYELAIFELSPEVRSQEVFEVRVFLKTFLALPQVNN